MSAYRILYSDDGQKWTAYREPGMDKDKVKITTHFLGMFCGDSQL